MLINTHSTQPRESATDVEQQRDPGGTAEDQLHGGRLDATNALSEDQIKEVKGVIAGHGTVAVAHLQVTLQLRCRAICRCCGGLAKRWTLMAPA